MDLAWNYPMCENAKTLDGDRRSYASKTVLALKVASTLNLKNVILAAFRSFAFLYRQGHSRHFCPVPQTFAYPLTAAGKQTSTNRRLGPMHKVAALQPAAREQELRGRGAFWVASGLIYALAHRVASDTANCHAAPRRSFCCVGCYSAPLMRPASE